MTIIFYFKLAEPFANFQPVFETKCIQFANKEEGRSRRKHYNKVLSEEAMKKNFPQLQEVIYMPTHSVYIHI